MDNTKLLNLIQTFENAIETTTIESATAYAFKPKKLCKSNSNQYITSDYEVYDIQLSKKDVISSINCIVSYFKNKYLLDTTTTYEEYNINNSKKVIDYICLQDIDFTDDDILKGTVNNLDANCYKVKYLMHCIYTTNNIAKTKSDYKGLRFLALDLTTTDNKSILFINKGVPLSKSKNFKSMIYSFDMDDNDVEKIKDFKPIKNDLLKIPIHPSALIIDDYCFMISDNIENIFGFEDYNKKLCSTTLNSIKKDLILDDSSINLLNKFALKEKNYNLFAAFDDCKLNDIKRKKATTITFLKEQLHLQIDSNYNITISTDNDAKKLINFICGFIKIDPINRLPCYSHKNTPIE